MVLRQARSVILNHDCDHQYGPIFCPLSIVLSRHDTDFDAAPGPLTGVLHQIADDFDQILPVGFPGFKNWNIYPIKGSNYAKATATARGATRGGKCEFWTFNTSFGPTVAQVVQFNLGKIGLNCNITPFDRVVETDKAGVKGAQYDLLLNGWGQDYPDPYDFINILLSGTSIQPANNVNLSYFNSAVWNKRMTAASHLSGQARYNAYAKLDRDLMKGPAPVAPYINTNARIFISKRVGCYVYSQVYGSDLSSICVNG